jgi:hypothetical protein
MISKGNFQSGGWMIGAEMSAFFKISKASRHSSLKKKGASLAKRLVRGLVI